MSSPATGLQIFLIGSLLGMQLGLCYGFLRPIRPRWLGDLIFLPVMGWVWLYFSFAICQGDLRMGYYGGMILGVVIWEMTLGRLIDPIFWKFWAVVRMILKKILKILKNMFASVKKWSTIYSVKYKWLGGVFRGRKKEHIPPDPSGLPTQCAHRQMGGAGNDRGVHPGTGGVGRGHQ